VLPSLLLHGKKLQLALAEAQKSGLFGLESEARLALGELEMKNNPGPGKANLAALRESTHTHGFELVARKASDLLSKN
jgi:hypothetical protein